MRKIKTIEELKKYVEYLFFNTTKIDFTYEDYEYMCTWGMDCSNEEVAFAFGILYDINKQTNSILIYCLKDDVENIYVKNHSSRTPRIFEVDENLLNEIYDYMSEIANQEIEKILGIAPNNSILKLT